MLFCYIKGIINDKRERILEKIYFNLNLLEIAK